MMILSFLQIVRTYHAVSVHRHPAYRSNHRNPSLLAFDMHLSMHDIPEPEFLNGSPEIDSKESIPPDWKIPALETDVCVADHL
jgi:hypothetical protein